MSARSIKLRGPRLYPAQHAAIFDPARHVFIEASTKAGKTVGCLVWQISEAFGRVGHHWWVAPIWRQSRIAFDRAQKYLPREVIAAVNKTEQSIELVNGSVWSFRGSENTDALYGEDVISCVIDEASRCKDGTWDAVRSTLTATRGRTRVIGNVKGRKNWFYRLARKAAAGQKGYAYHKLTAWDAVAGGVLAREEIEQARADLPPDVFAELYLAQASADGSNPFGSDDDIDRLVRPMSRGIVVASGFDLARKMDFTVDIGLDAAGVVAAFDRWQKPWAACIEDLARKIEVRSEAVGAAEYVGDRVLASHPVAVDSTGLGDVVSGQLASGIVVDRGTPAERVIVASNLEPFIFNAPRKQVLYDNLIDALRTGRVSGITPEIAAEMKDFTYAHTRTGVRYEAAAGLHDDCVDALALATWALVNGRPAGGGWIDASGGTAWT